MQAHARPNERLGILDAPPSRGMTTERASTLAPMRDAGTQGRTEWRGRIMWLLDSRLRGNERSVAGSGAMLAVASRIELDSF
jgi:hypothetical protein